MAHRKRQSGRPNRERRHTVRAKVQLCGAVASMAAVQDRRTASAWFVAAGVQNNWDRFHDCLISIGRKSRQIATVVLGLVVTKFAPGPGDRIVVGLDDSPTQRFGRHVEGAGVHHHPTPEPGRGAVGPGGVLSRCQGSLGRGPAASPQRPVQHRLLASEPVAVHTGRTLFVGPGERDSHRPQRSSLG
jgi:hypothetical protein